MAGVGAVLGAATPAAAQWPGTLDGVVVDEATGRGVPYAEIRLEPGPVEVLADGGGAFSVRGLEPGPYVVHASALGYLASRRAVEIENGRRNAVRIGLAPDALALGGLEIEADAAPTGGLRLSAADIRALPAATAGDVLGSVPGVVVASEGRGGPQRISIRGSGADAVLVLVDGVPLNDPVTGEADLSLVPASALSQVTVLPGGRSARWGPRAEAGVVIVETLGGDALDRASLTAGSLGELGAEAGAHHPLFGGALEAAVDLRRLHGRFDFALPEEVGGGERTRKNADVERVSARLGWTAGGAGREVTLGTRVERTRRGLPGRSFVPSTTSRQTLERLALSAGLRDVHESGSTIQASLFATAQRTDVGDPAPPLGPPYDDRTDLLGLGGRAELTRPFGTSLSTSIGASAGYLRVASTALTEGDVTRTDGGVWASVAFSPASPALSLTGALRLDRGSLPARWYVSHDLGVSARAGGWDLRLGHRSSYSPPTLGDQYFREGVGVAPNPELEPERVPSEWVVGAARQGRWSSLELGLRLEAYTGDVRGMIVWLPDFRFVWSPRNLDARRRGVDLRGTLDWAGRLSLAADASWTRATYDRPAHPDVQLVYRPRLQGGVRARWSGGPWALALATRFTGARFPVPNAVNELPGFWTSDASLSRVWRVGRTPVELGLEVQRLFDHDDALIFGFPDPGRTLRLSLAVTGDLFR
jgi:outer membrane cobalamin receptor